MDTDIFCVLCGGPFALEQHVYNIDPDKESFQWLYSVCLLGTPSALHAHRMTSAGEFHTNLSGNDSVFLSETLHWKITDSDCFRLGESFYHVLAEDEAGDALFPLHEACIEIASKVIASQASPPDPSNGLVSKSLYDHLKRKFQAGHYDSGARQNVFGLQSVCARFGPRSVLALEEVHWWGGAYEKYFTDPLWIPDLTPVIFTMLQPLSRASHGHKSIEKTQRPLCSIEALPNELLDRITNMLPPQSLMSLRQCSRTLARNIPLDDRFWRKHICDASLLPYLWGVDEAEFKFLLQCATSEDPVDWKGLIRHLVPRHQLPPSNRDASSYAELPQGLWNRCRIWNIIADGLFDSSVQHQNIPSKCSNGQNADRVTKFDFQKASVMLGFIIILGMAYAWDVGYAEKPSKPFTVHLTTT